MEDLEKYKVSKDTQKFVKYLADMPAEKHDKLIESLEALEKQCDAEACLEKQRGWRYMWQRTPKPFLLMLAYLVFLAPVGSLGYQNLSSIPEGDRTFYLIILVTILPLAVVFYLSYHYLKQKPEEEGEDTQAQETVQ